MFFFMADIFEVLALTTPHTTSRSPMKRPASKVVAAKSVAKSRRRWIGFQLNMVCLFVTFRMDLTVMVPDFKRPELFATLFNHVPSCACGTICKFSYFWDAHTCSITVSPFWFSLKIWHPIPSTIIFPLKSHEITILGVNPW